MQSALIIACSVYEDSLLRELVAPAQDAESLARALSDPLIGNFEVHTVLNRPSYEVNREIESFFSDRKRNDLLLLYFSGHGVKDEDGQLYFATADTQSKFLRSTAVWAHFVNDVMRRSRSRRQILLLDCCYSGAFARGMVVKAGLDVGIKDQFDGTGRVVLTASDAMQYSFEGTEVEGRGLRSVFTQFLVQGIETGEADLDGDGLISLDELYDYVYERVTIEVPHQSPIKWALGVQGEIIIARSPRSPGKTVELPEELRQAIQSGFPLVREEATRELDRLLHGKHKGLALAARAALMQLVEDDSRRVSNAAKNYLSSYAESGSPADTNVHGAQSEQIHTNEISSIAKENEGSSARTLSQQEKTRQMNLEQKSPGGEASDEGTSSLESQAVRGIGHRIIYWGEKAATYSVLHRRRAYLPVIALTFAWVAATLVSSLINDAVWTEPQSVAETSRTTQPAEEQRTTSPNTNPSDSTGLKLTRTHPEVVVTTRSHYFLLGWPLQLFLCFVFTVSLVHWIKLDWPFDTNRVVWLAGVWIASIVITELIRHYIYVGWLPEQWLNGCPSRDNYWEQLSVCAPTLLISFIQTGLVQGSVMGLLLRLRQPHMTWRQILAITFLVAAGNTVYDLVLTMILNLQPPSILLVGLSAAFQGATGATSICFLISRRPSVVLAPAEKRA